MSQKAIQDANDAKTAQEGKFAEQTQDTSDLLEAIDECIGLMQQLQNDSNSGVSLMEVSNSAAKLLKTSAKAKKAGAVAPVMMAMVQTFQDKYSDQGKVSRVIELFLELRANTEQAQTDFTTTHNQIISDNDAIITSQTTIFDDLVSDADILKAHINTMDACYTQMCEDEDEATAKKERNQELLDDATTACDEWFENYEDLEEDRTNEIATINTLKALVEEKLNQFGGREIYGADDRANTYAEDFSAYENKYVYSGPGYDFDVSVGEGNAEGADEGDAANDAGDGY